MLKKYCFFLIFFVCCVSIYSQQTIKIWGKDHSDKKKNCTLTVFLPEIPDVSGISVIICPGGSYYWLDMNNEGFSVAKYLNSKGITAFVLHYRTAINRVHHPAMIQDLQCAMQFVKNNAEIYKINSQKVGVMGFSAGGHLAGTAAEYFDMPPLTTSKDGNSSSLLGRVGGAKPYFAAMIYPVVSMEDSICHKQSRENLLGKNYSVELQKAMSLEQNVRSDMPPIFLLHCTGDKTVDYRNSVIFDKALTDNDVKHKFLLLDEHKHWGHGFGIQPIGTAAGWINEFIKFVYELDSTDSSYTNHND
jgi:acetyl esterase/lipase